jgi:tetratricopeptide (TPR) repeat protein
VYELAFSWMSLGEDLEGLARFIESELGSGVEQMVGLHVVLGSAYDGLGDYAKAESAFRRGLEAAPNDALLRYNLGVNLKLQERWAEAASSFQIALRLRPMHASAWKGLAEAEERMGLAVRAFFAHARVANLEPTSDRGKASAGRLWPLLFEHVEDEGTPDATTGKRHISITIPSDKTGDDAGEASDAEPTLESLELVSTAILAANRYVEEWEKKTDAAFFAHAMGTLPQMLAELGAPDKDPFWSLILPFFLEARAKGHSEALAYDLLSIAGDPNAQIWIAKHAKRVQAYSKWLGR